MTILLVEQNANLALKLSDRAYCLKTERFLCQDRQRNGNESRIKDYILAVSCYENRELDIARKGEATNE